MRRLDDDNDEDDAVEDVNADDGAVDGLNMCLPLPALAIAAATDAALTPAPPVASAGATELDADDEAADEGGVDEGGVDESTRTRIASASRERSLPISISSFCTVFNASSSFFTADWAPRTMLSNTGRGCAAINASDSGANALFDINEDDEEEVDKEEEEEDLDDAFRFCLCFCVGDAPPDVFDFPPFVGVAGSPSALSLLFFLLLLLLRF